VRRVTTTGDGAGGLNSGRQKSPMKKAMAMKPNRMAPRGRHADRSPARLSRMNGSARIVIHSACSPTRREFKLWDVTKGKEILTLRGHTDAVGSMNSSFRIFG